MSADRPYYHKFAWAYDLLQADPVAARMDFVESVLSNQGIGANSSILDAGCGTGRYTVDLARRGYHVCGVDRSSELIAVAQNRTTHAAFHPEFMIADLLTIRFARVFDAILCRGVLNDVVEESDRIVIFQHFADWLRPGGIAIFDVREWAGTVVRYEKGSVHHRTVALPDGTLDFQSQTVLDPESHQMRIRECFTVTRNGITTRDVNDFLMKCWTMEEIRNRLLAAGFDEIGSYPSYGESDRAWSDRLVLLVRKRLKRFG